ncbi:MAG: LacI family DNA-binding transcriptional regulator [Clostridiales bacterium]|nr:LacI family DNA-binding transcriptional regulator [Clostridiales bacterium]
MKNIKDIAKLAGVGVSTVSRVLNNHPDVNAETRIKIQKIIDSQSYIPNRSARNLKMSPTKNIGVIVKGSFNPFFSEIVEIMEKNITKRNFSLLIHYNPIYDTEDAEIIIEQVKEKRLNGVIYLGGNFSKNSNSYLKSLDIPLVLASSNIDSDVDKKNFSSISIDNVQSAFEAVDYLCQMRHKNIGLLSSGLIDKHNGKLRTTGYEKALIHNNISLNHKYHRNGFYTFDSGYNMAKDILTIHPEITALFSTSDIIAIGAAKYILSTGRNIPEDISIIGFDGLEYSEFFHPSISSVKQPIEAIGEKAVELLFSNTKKHILLQTKLITRNSVCKAKGEKI